MEKYECARRNSHLLTDEQKQYIVEQAERETIEQYILLQQKAEEFKALPLSKKISKLTKNLGIVIYQECIGRWYDYDNYICYLMAKKLSDRIYITEHNEHD